MIGLCRITATTKNSISRWGVKRVGRLMSEPLNLGLSHPNLGMEMGEKSEE